MKVSDYIAKFLYQNGIEYIFELSGGMIAHILDSLFVDGKINVISMHHEQAAAFAAEGWARISGTPGVALATSGPGAINLLTGIGSCYYDSTPAIFITGQVNRHELKGKKNIRQLGFQETDIVSMSKPITKWSVQIKNPEEIPAVFKKAYEIAMEGRPGPVLIDIPMDVQRAQIEDTIIDIEESKSKLDNVVLDQLIFDIQNAKRPLILAGRGIKASGSQNLFDIFKSHVNIPVICTLLGLDTISFDDNLRVGFIGSYGNRWANIAFGQSDLVIVLGARLDIRQTGADTKFIENRKIYHIDCEADEINNRVKNCVPIVSDLKYFFTRFIERSKKHNFVFKNSWMADINVTKEKWPDTEELKPVGINPNKFMHTLSLHSKLAKAFVVDVGAHQMWAAQSLEIYKGQSFLTSGGMGSMGFSLPAAIGASFALEKKPVVVIAGDGCMQINIQELQTIVRNKLPIKIIVLNNKALGMIRQFQDSYFDGRYQSTYWGYDTPDFEKVAIAYNIDSKTIDSENQILDAVKWFWSEDNLHKPQFLQVMIDSHTNTYPKIAFGKPITEMEPFVKPIEMEGT